MSHEVFFIELEALDPSETKVESVRDVLQLFKLLFAAHVALAPEYPDTPIMPSIKLYEEES